MWIPFFIMWSPRRRTAAGDAAARGDTRGEIRPRTRDTLRSSLWSLLASSFGRPVQAPDDNRPRSEEPGRFSPSAFTGPAGLISFSLSCKGTPNPAPRGYASLRAAASRCADAPNPAPRVYASLRAAASRCADAQNPAPRVYASLRATASRCADAPIRLGSVSMARIAWRRFSWPSRSSHMPGKSESSHAGPSTAMVSR